MDKDGNFKAVYYDALFGHDHKSKLKVIENGKRKLIDISNEQQEEMQRLVTSFLAGNKSYDENGNEDKDHSLLAWSSESNGREANYYYWKNDELPSKGVETLLEFIDKLRQS